MGFFLEKFLGLLKFSQNRREIKKIYNDPSQPQKLPILNPVLKPHCLSVNLKKNQTEGIHSSIRLCLYYSRQIDYLHAKI